MNISYDLIDDAFLNKITEFEFLSLPEANRTHIIDGYRSRAITSFKKNCRYDLSIVDPEKRTLADNFAECDVDEIVDIISEGMLIQWMKPYVNKQELLENTINTRDYQTYSPAGLLNAVKSSYMDLKREYTQLVREYSYNHGDLRGLHI